MPVGVCDGLKLEELFAQGAEVDVERSCWGRTRWEGLGKEFVVVSRWGAGGERVFGGRGRD